MSTSDWKLARVLDFEQHINPRDIQCHNERTGWTFYKHRAFFAPRKMHWLASEAKWDSLPSEENKKTTGASACVCVWVTYHIRTLASKLSDEIVYCVARLRIIFDDVCFYEPEKPTDKRNARRLDFPTICFSTHIWKCLILFMMYIKKTNN